MLNAGNRTFIIAEAGVNHNGSLELARELVEAAAAAKADAFKIQTFKADKLVTKSAQCAAYQERNMGSSGNQYEMLKALELDTAAHLELKALCETRGIEFMSTGFDGDSIEFLVREIGIRRVKIPSGEATNPILLAAAWRTGLPVILSTGMCTQFEVMESLSLFAWLDANDGVGPSSRTELAAFRDGGGWLPPLANRVSILHCVTQYPAPAAATNLSAIPTLAEATGLVIGLSDHSEGWHIATASIAAGARIIEKHYTLSRSMEGPDHAASLEPDELARMVREMRDVEAALGTGIKAPDAAELGNMAPARGSLVAAARIKAGEPFGAHNIAIKRPGTGVAPAAYWDYIGGRKADRDYRVDDQIAAAD